MPYTQYRYYTWGELMVYLKLMGVKEDDVIVFLGEFKFPVRLDAMRVRRGPHDGIDGTALSIENKYAWE